VFNNSIIGDYMARPKIVINWQQVDQMCAIHCTGEEQASILGVNYDTLNRACKREHKKSFADYFKQKSATGKMSLRRTQFTVANGGNPTMLIWLGKNWLNQNDNLPEPETAPPELNISFNVAEPQKEIKTTIGKKKEK
jgi:hypothetical protein